MKLIQYKESFCAFDGKIILMINIDFPYEVCDPASKYIKEFSDCCLSFSKDVLFKHISKEYNSTFSTCERFVPYLYKLSVSENIIGDLSDYTFNVSLFRGVQSLSQSQKTVRFRNNTVILYRRKSDPAV